MTLPAGIIVRAATPDDAAAHVTLWKGVVAESRWMEMEAFDHSVDEYRRLFEHSVTNDGARYAAIAGRDVAGSIRIARINGAAHQHVAYFTMAVAAHWRRRGIGAALLAAAIEWAHSHGVERIVLNVFASNSAAIALYRKAGFLEEGILRKHTRKPWGDEDEIMMALVNP